MPCDDNSKLTRLRRPVRLDVGATKVRVSHVEPVLLEVARSLSAGDDPPVLGQIRCRMRVAEPGGEGRTGTFDLMAPHDCDTPGDCFLRHILRGILHELMHRAEQRARARKQPTEVGSPWPYPTE